MEKCQFCNNKIECVKPLKCKFCSLKFCTINCLIIHFPIHNNIKNEEAKKLMRCAKRKYSRKISQKYLFLTPGIYHENEIEFSQKYSINNFSKVLDGFLPVELGSGAYGRVYLVIHNKTKEEFALKVIEKKKLLNIHGKCDIIYNEIKIHSKLEHPNIIKLYSMHETDKEINIIMEYAKNGNLFQLIAKNNSGLSEKIAFHYFIQVVNAVYFLHENQIIHRDIKPENLLIDDNNTIKLCDFGWAKQLTLKNRSSFCGTVEYMAPEIIENGNYDFSVDIWSLGILLYELLIGHSPFKDKTTKNTIVNIKLHEIKFDKEISDDSKDLINKLLEVNKEKRINIKDILNHDFIKKNENLMNSLLSNNLFNELFLDKVNDFTSCDMNYNNKFRKNIYYFNLHPNEKQISRSINPFKNCYSKSITSLKFENDSIKNLNCSIPKKENLKYYISRNKSSKIYTKSNPRFDKIRNTLNSEVEKSKKKMELLNMKASKRYSFEEIKEKNKKLEEKKNLNINTSNINRELVKFNSSKNPPISQNNKLLNSFDEYIFIDELINICKKHNKEYLYKDFL